MNYKNVSRLTLNDLNGNSLEHHGIKGQKWGVRRFQDLSGALTALGKKRYYGEGRVNRSNKRIAKYTSELAKTSDKQKQKALKTRIQTEKDRNAFREKVRDRHEARTTGSKVLHNLLLGPYANLAVNNMREAGYSDFATYGAMVAAQLLGGPLIGNSIVSRAAMNAGVNRKNQK